MLKMSTSLLLQHFRMIVLPPDMFDEIHCWPAQAALAAVQGAKKSAERPATARERAMSFAKCIPRPASGARLTQSAQGRLIAAVGGGNGSGCEGSGGSRLGTAQQRREDELARLQRQHEADQRDVAAIAQDLRMHAAAQAAGH